MKKLPRWAFVCLVLLVAPLVLLVIGVAAFYIYSDHHGSRALEKAMSDIRLRGEPLTMEEIEEPPISDKENFAAAPILSEALTEPDEEKRRLADWPRFVLCGAAEDSYLRRRALAVDPDFDGSDEDAARLILQEMSNHTGLLEEIREASTRPGTQWHRDYRQGFTLPLGHMTALIPIAQSIAAKGVAHIALRQPDQAFADVVLILNFAERCQHGKLLIAILLEMAMLTIALEVIADGIENHVWTDQQLLEFQERLAGIDLPNDFAESLRAERVVFLSTVQSFYANKGDFRKLFLPESELAPPERLDLMLWQARPSGWMKEDMALHVTSLQMFIDSSNPLRRETPALIERMDTDIENAKMSQWNRLKLPFALLGFTPIKYNVTRMAYVSCLMDQTRIACAIERYRLRHGEPPRELESLTPNFINLLPDDPMSGELYIYQVDGDNAWTLYGVGWNQRDDGGRRSNSGSRQNHNSDDWLWHHR